jgi:predicted transcriptional regulator
MNFKFLYLSLFLSKIAFSEPLELGASAPKLIIDGADGGRLDGKAWDSDSIKGQVTSVIYIDPEEKSKNEPLEEMYKKEKFPFETHKSVGIINMKAAWYPNAMIENVNKKNFQTRCT